MKIKQYSIYLADLEPAYGSAVRGSEEPSGSRREPGKVRPVVVVQTDFMNKGHRTKIVCPLTTNLVPESKILRVYLAKEEIGLKQDSDILVDQIQSIDNRRFIKKIGDLTTKHQRQLADNLKIILFE